MLMSSFQNIHWSIGIYVKNMRSQFTFLIIIISTKIIFLFCSCKLVVAAIAFSTLKKVNECMNK